MGLMFLKLIIKLITSLARNAYHTLCTNWGTFLSEQRILIFLSYILFTANATKYVKNYIYILF